MDEFSKFRLHKRWRSWKQQHVRITARAGVLLLLLLAGIGIAVRPDATADALGFAAPDQMVAVKGRGFTLCGYGRDNCVIDGDTIRYRGERIRIEDIDTPETHKPRCVYEYQLGQRATWRLLELINMGSFEIVHTGTHDRDVYGRKLRRLERNGKSLGKILVEEGLARRWDGARHPWCN